MNFFKLSTGEAVKSTGEVELGGNAVIPENTTCEAMIVECGWASYEGKNYVNAKWQVTKPTQYANRVVLYITSTYNFSAHKIYRPDDRPDDRPDKFNPI